MGIATQDINPTELYNSGPFDAIVALITVFSSCQVLPQDSDEIAIFGALDHAARPSSVIAPEMSMSRLGGGEGQPAAASQLPTALSADRPASMQPAAPSAIAAGSY